MKKNILKIIITLVVFSVLVWSSRTTSTSSTVVIKEVGVNEIVVETSNQGNQVIKIHSTLQHLIFEDKRYYIKYTKKRWGKPTLDYIEPELN